MASGRPDFYYSMVVNGKYGSDYIPVAVDSLGDLMAIINGKYGSGYVPVGVDASGNLIAVMKGTFGAALKTVAVDTDGLLLTNISRQGLAYLKVMPVYGQCLLGSTTGAAITPGDYQDVLTITGQGAILNSYMQAFSFPSTGTFSFRFLVDGVEAYKIGGTHQSLAGYYYVPEDIFPWTIFEPVTGWYRIVTPPNIVFNSSIKFQAKWGGTGNLSVDVQAIYSLVPP